MRAIPRQIRAWLRSIRSAATDRDRISSRQRRRKGRRFYLCVYPSARTLPGKRRARQRQRDPRRNFRLQRLVQVPLAHAKAARAPDQIEMNMRLMLCIGAGAKHRREAVTGAVAQFLAKLFCNGYIGETEGASVRQYE